MYNELYFVGLQPFGYYHNRLEKTFLNDFCDILQRKIQTISVIKLFYRSYYMAPIYISEYTMVGDSPKTSCVFYRLPSLLLQLCLLFRYA